MAATAPLPAAVVPHGGSSESSCPYSHPDTSPQSHLGKSTAPASDRQCSMVVRLGAQMPQSCNDSAEMTVPWSGGSVAWGPTTTSPQTNYWRSSAWLTSLPFSDAADYDGLGMWSVPPPILALAWWGTSLSLARGAEVGHERPGPNVSRPTSVTLDCQPWIHRIE